MRLAQVHSTDKARRWFTVDFVVSGLGFKDDIAIKLGAQVNQPSAHDALSMNIHLGRRMHSST